MSLAFANLLFKSLNMKIENFLNSPLKKGELDGGAILEEAHGNKKPFVI